MDGLIFEREVVFRRNCLRRTATVVGGAVGRSAPLGEFPGISGVFQILCCLPFHPLLGRGRRVRFSGGRMGNRAGFHRPGLCPWWADSILPPLSCAVLPPTCFACGPAGAVHWPALLGALPVPLSLIHIFFPFSHPNILEKWILLIIRKNFQKFPKQYFQRQKAHFASHGEIYFSIFFAEKSCGIHLRKRSGRVRI